MISKEAEAFTKGFNRKVSNLLDTEVRAHIRGNDDPYECSQFAAAMAVVLVKQGAMVAVNTGGMKHARKFMETALSVVADELADLYDITKEEAKIRLLMELTEG